MRVTKKDALFQEITLEWAHGRCAWFALAAAANWSLPLVGFEDETGRLVHVACQTNSGLFDAYGLGSEAQVIDAFRSLGSHSQMHRRSVSAARVREAFQLTESEHETEIADAIYVCERVLHELGIPALQYHARNYYQPFLPASRKKQV
jgi:hypothetical protein